jgi:hypothetical protein
VRVLFDQGTPNPLRRFLTGHDVSTAHERGWSTLRNGELLREAERDGYEVLVTTDGNLRYQQNLLDRRLAVVVLLSTSWPRIQRSVQAVIDAIGAAGPGSYTEIDISQ